MQFINLFVADFDEGVYQSKYQSKITKEAMSTKKKVLAVYMKDCEVVYCKPVIHPHFGEGQAYLFQSKPAKVAKAKISRLPKKTKVIEMSKAA